jgi:hypothetical protein
MFSTKRIRSGLHEEKMHLGKPYVARIYGFLHRIHQKKEKKLPKNLILNGKKPKSMQNAEHFYYTWKTVCNP